MSQTASFEPDLRWLSCRPRPAMLLLGRASSRSAEAAAATSGAASHERQDRPPTARARPAMVQVGRLGVGTGIAQVAAQPPNGREPVIAAKWALIWAWLSSESYIATLPIAP